MMRLPTKSLCPHIVIRRVPVRGMAGTTRVVAFPCSEPPMSHGWCKGHEAGHEIMVIGRDFGYRALAVRPTLEIGEGKVFWEAMAIVASDRIAGWVRMAVQKARMAQSDTLNLAR